MPGSFTQTQEVHVTLHPGGQKGVRRTTTTYMDGVPVGPPKNHRCVYERGAFLPQDVLDCLIEHGTPAGP